MNTQAAIVLLAAALAAACGNDTPTSPTRLPPSAPSNITMTASTWQGSATVSGQTATLRLSVNEMSAPGMLPLISGTYELRGDALDYSGMVSGLGGQDIWQLTLLAQPQTSCPGQPFGLPGGGALRTTLSGNRITGTLTLLECGGPSEWQVDLLRQ